MASHFYSINAVGEGTVLSRNAINVATSTVSANNIELRVDDATMTGKQIAAFLENIRKLFIVRDPQVIAPGTVKI